MLARDLLIDACALINLINGQIAEDCANAIEPRPTVVEAVRRECRVNNETALLLTRLLDEQTYQLIDEVVAPDKLIEFMEEHRLGAGESEAIILCMELAKHLWSDDRRARNIATVLMADGHVTGTAGILRDLVVGGDLEHPRAVAAYARMRQLGGYLPNFPEEFFSQAPS